MKIYLDKANIDTIVDSFKEKELIKNDIINLSKYRGTITAHGLIIDSYVFDINSIFNTEVEMILDSGKHLNIFPTNYYDPLVVTENYGIRLLKGLDNEIYSMSSKYFKYENKEYSIFPNYLLKYNGSIEIIEGSELDNFNKLKGMQEFKKIIL